MTETIDIEQVDHVGIRVADAERAIAAFRDAVEVAESMEPPSGRFHAALH